MRKAGTEAGRDKAWLANANFNLGFAFGGCCPQGKVGKEEGRGKTRPASANFNLGFAFGGCCAQGKVGKEAGKGKASLVKADFNLGFAFGGCLCAKLAKRQARAKSDWQMPTSASVLLLGMAVRGAGKQATNLEGKANVIALD